MLAASTASIQTPVAVADSSGGMIVAWVDLRSDAGDIYVQRVDVNGNVRWNANGLAAGVAAAQQTKVVIAPDGAGGAFLAWEDYRNGASNADIYCQHVTAAGAIAPGWPASGLQVAGQTGHQLSPSLASDGGTGAYVAWEEHHYATSDVFANHLLAGGVDGTWPAIGATVYLNPSSFQGPPKIAADGVGGAYVIWPDTRNAGQGVDLYMNRLLSNGTLAWAASGVAIAAYPADQTSPVLAATPGSGVTVVFQDATYSGTEGWNLASTYVSIAGTHGNIYDVATSSGDDIAATIAGGANGATFVAWQQNGSDWDIEARILCSGAPCGAIVPMSTATFAQTLPVAVSDGAGGGIAAWWDFRFSGQVYSQRLTSSGVAPWTANGVFLGNTGSSAQYSPAAVADSKGGALVAFVQAQGAGAWLAAERIEHFGNLGNPEPTIANVFDVGPDQGGQVHLVWDASYLDTDPDFTVGSYNVWRQIDSGTAARAIARGAHLLGEDERPADGPALRTSLQGGVTLTWEFLGSVPARGAPTYSFPAATLADSMADGPHDTVFMVDAQARSGFAFWSSAPDSGHSVDNLAPAMPSAFTGNYGAGAAHLHWNPNREADLGGYRLYRGSDSSFVPSPANLVATLSDTGYADVGPAGATYKLAAIDVHGNSSAYAVLTRDAQTDVPPGGVVAFGLAEVRPNPARVSAEIAFSLPNEERVRLDVYDVSGRVRRTLLDGPVPAGTRNLRWDLRDTSGHPVDPGLYFVELRSPSGTLVRRSMVLE